MVFKWKKGSKYPKKIPRGLWKTMKDGYHIISRSVIDAPRGSYLNCSLLDIWDLNLRSILTPFKKDLVYIKHVVWIYNCKKKSDLLPKIPMGSLKNVFFFYLKDIHTRFEWVENERWKWSYLFLAFITFLFWKVIAKVSMNYI